MKLFECQNCGQLLYFENIVCEKCHHSVGYLPQASRLLTLQAVNQGQGKALEDASKIYRYCENHQYQACNWLIPIDSPDTFCKACQLNHTIPDLDNPLYLQRWQRLEFAKHRLVYTLLRLRLPLTTKAEDEEKGLAFDFLAETAADFRESPQVITGHAQGLITINIAEADDAEREKQRSYMAEPYRTVLGHFRHESGHYYWERLIQNTENLPAFRKLFGDETQDYGQSLEKHYESGPPTDWPSHFISAYASTHPWEDWAETWAHYLHIIDTLETAYAFGLRVKPRVGQDELLSTRINFDAYQQLDFEELIESWLPLTFAVNSLNRSMGQPDLYPFVLAIPVREKLQFIHQIIHHQ